MKKLNEKISLNFAGLIAVLVLSFISINLGMENYTLKETNSRLNDYNKEMKVLIKDQNIALMRLLDYTLFFRNAAFECYEISNDSTSTDTVKHLEQ